MSAVSPVLVVNSIRAIAQVRVAAQAPWGVVLPVRATGQILVVRQHPQLVVLFVGVRVALLSLVSVPRRVDTPVLAAVQIRLRGQNAD